MKECKGLLSMWSTTDGKLQADSKRGPAEAALKAMTLQVLAWKACMDSYESAAEDFIATLHILPPARTLQANIVYHGCVHYICLLSKLTEHFDAVVGLLSSAISTRKCMATRKSLTECGVYSEFFSGDARGVRPQASVAVAWWVMTWVCSWVGDHTILRRRTPRQQLKLGGASGMLWRLFNCTRTVALSSLRRSAGRIRCFRIRSTLRC